MALSSLLTDWRPFPTASLHVDFLRGIRVGDTVECHGTVVRAGRRLSVVDATLHDGGGQLLARGTCTFAVDLSDTDLVGFTAL
jgi:acyl-coenzyme A thioesterase PaaI-like protein